MNGRTFCVRTEGSGAGSGAGYEFPEVLLHITQVRSKDLINCRPAGIQYDCHRAVRVAPVPEWHSVLCKLGKRGVTWKFIPKWWGGFWERMVGLTKSVLKEVLGRRHITLVTLETVTTEIEAALNDRPLTFVPSEQGELEPLTPAHLLHGRRITCLPHEVIGEDELIDPTYGDMCGNAKLLAAILQDFRSVGVMSTSRPYEKFIKPMVVIVRLL